jgi:hypothetical protein
VTLTADEVAMFYNIYSYAARVDWACYEAFRLAILVEGAEQTATHVATDTPALNDAGSPSHPDTPASSSLEPFVSGANPDNQAVKRYSADLGEAAEELRTINRDKAGHSFRRGRQRQRRGSTGAAHR